MERKYIGELLVEEGYINRDQLVYALNLKKNKYHSKKLGKILLDLEYISDDVLINLLGKQCGIQGVNLYNRTIPNSVIKLISRKISKKFGIIPLGFKKSETAKKLVIATSDPSDLIMIDHICFITGQVIELVYARKEDIDWAIKYYYNESEVIMQ